MVKRSKKKVLGRGLSVLLGDDEKNTFGKEVENIDQEVIGKIIQKRLLSKEYKAEILSEPINKKDFKNV